MADQPAIAPDELQVPRFRFWGDRTPPKNRADMFSVRTAKAATLSAASTDGTTEVTGSVATMRIYGPIDSWGGWWGVSAKNVATALDSLPDDVVEVRVRINSPGGEVWEGMAILNMLRAHSARVVAVVDGLAASAASVVAVGCDETVMSPGTQMMIHDASGFAFGPVAVMTKAAKFLDSTSNAIASIYAEAAGGTDADWRALMVEETWYTAAEAVTANLAARVAVVPDAGDTSTAGEEPEPIVVVVEGDDPEARFDLSMYAHAGRSDAPAPHASAHSTNPTAPADGPDTTQEGSPAVAFSDEQVTSMRQALGLPEDADEATITAALPEALAERAETPATTTAQVPEGMTLIETGVLNTLRNGATAGVAARDQQLAEHRDRVIAKAIADGKTTPARKQHWVESWAADAVGTEETLNALASGLVPVDALGHEGDVSTPDQPLNINDDELGRFASSLGLSKEDLNG